MEASEFVLQRPFSSNGVMSEFVTPEPLPNLGPLDCFALNELLLVLFEKVHREPTSLSFCAIGASEQDAVIFHELVVSNFINKTTSVQFLALQRVNVLWCAVLTLLERHSLLVGAEQMEALDSDSESSSEYTAEHNFFANSSVPLRTTITLICLTFEVLLAKPGSVDSELTPEVDRAVLFLRHLAPLLLFGPLAEGALTRLVLASLLNPAAIELKNALANRAAISAPPSTHPLVLMKYLAPFSRVKTQPLDKAQASRMHHPAPTLAQRAAAWATAGSEAAIAVDEQQRSHAEFDAATSATSTSTSTSTAAAAATSAASAAATITMTSEKACQASVRDTQSNSIRTTAYQGASSFRQFVPTHPYIAGAGLLAPAPVPAPVPAPAPDPDPTPAPAPAPSRDGTGFSLRLRSALPFTSSVNQGLESTQELSAGFALSSALERSRKLEPLCSLGILPALSTSQSVVGFDALS